MAEVTDDTAVRQRACPFSSATQRTQTEPGTGASADEDQEQSREEGGPSRAGGGAGCVDASGNTQHLLSFAEFGESITS